MNSLNKNQFSKKFFSLLVVSVLVFNICFSVFADTTKTNGDLVKEEIEESQDLSSFHEKAKKQEKAVNEYNKLMNSIHDSNKRSSDEAFPEYYGGAFIDENDDLVVLVTTKEKSGKEKVKEATENSDTKIKEAKHSYNDLLKIQTKVEKTYTSLYKKNNEDVEIKSILDDITGIYIDDKGNQVVVQIKELSVEKEELFNKLFGNSELIVFEDGFTYSDTAIDWRPGRKIYSDTGYLSTGYSAYSYNSSGSKIYGFVTAGHSFSNGDEVYTSSSRSSVLGICRSSKNSGSVDAAFIEITSSTYENSNKVYYSDSSGAGSGVTLKAGEYTTSVAQGEKVYKAGAKTYLTEGTVLSSSHSETFSGKVFTDLLKASTLNLGGDSGGVAYIYHNGNYVVCGTMKGSNHSGDDLTEASFKYSLISQIDNQRSALDIYKD